MIEEDEEESLPYKKIKLTPQLEENVATTTHKKKKLLWVPFIARLTRKLILEIFISSTFLIIPAPP